jgi:hypothetical protein
MNTTKDPVYTVTFGGRELKIRWDYNAVAELQDLGYDLTPGSPDLKKLEDGPKMPLKLIRAMCTAALRAGSDDGEQFCPVWVGRTMTAEGDKSELLKAVLELRKAVEPEEESRPLPPDAPNA